MRGDAKQRSLFGGAGTRDARSDAGGHPESADRATAWRWQHAISPTKALRYSITFRTLRDGTGTGAQILVDPAAGR